MENFDFWEELQRHGSLADTYLSEDPPHIRKMYLTACLRSLLFADSIAEKEIAEEDAARQKQQELATLKKEEEGEEKSKKKRKKKKSKKEKQKQEEEQEGEEGKPSAEAAANSDNDTDEEDQNEDDDEGEENENDESVPTAVVTSASPAADDSSSSSSSNSVTAMSQQETESKGKQEGEEGTAVSSSSSSSSLSSSLAFGEEGTSALFWSIAGLLRRCESPECQTKDSSDALRVLGPHNVVLTWISNTRSQLSNGSSVSTVGEAQTADDWTISVLCDGCIQKSIATMSSITSFNMNQVHKPDSKDAKAAASELSLERRRSAFLLVDVTAWPSWAGSVQYAPWLNIKWHSINAGGGGGGGGAGGGDTPSGMSEQSVRSSGAISNPSHSSTANNNNSKKKSSGERPEDVFENSLRKAFESGRAQGLFLLPEKRDSITMTLDNLVFFGYSCAHSDEHDVIRTALRNPSVYPILFHRVLPALRGVDLWRNRIQTATSLAAATERKKKEEKEKKKREKEQSSNSKSTTAISITAEEAKAAAAAESDLGRPAEWIHALETNLLPLRHPNICHFSTHCESLQAVNRDTAANSAASALLPPRTPQEGNNNNSSSEGNGGEGGENINNNNNNNNHDMVDAMTMMQLVDAEEQRTISRLEQQQQYQQQSSAIMGTAAGGGEKKKNQLTTVSKKKQQQQQQANSIPPRIYSLNVAFVSLHFFAGNSRLDSVSAWHIVPPKNVNNIVLEVTRNYLNPSVVSRLIRHLSQQLVGLVLVDCSFPNWSEFFDEILLQLPRLQSLSMMCCRVGLEDSLQDTLSPSNSSNLSSAVGPNNNTNISGGGGSGNFGSHNNYASSTSSSSSSSSGNSADFNQQQQQQHRRQHSRSHSQQQQQQLHGGSISSPNSSSSFLFSGGGGSGLLRGGRQQLLRLTSVQLRSVPVDAKTLSQLFYIAPNINKLVFPFSQNQRQKQNKHLDPEMNIALAERTFLTLSNNGTKLKDLNLLCEPPTSLFERGPPNAVAVFWSPFQNVQRLHCQGWLDGATLAALAQMPHLVYVDGASSLSLTRADLFEFCLIPALRREKEHRKFVNLEYLDISFCHNLARIESFSSSPQSGHATVSALGSPPLHQNNRKKGSSLSDEEVAKLIRRLFPKIRREKNNNKKKDYECATRAQSAKNSTLSGDSLHNNQHNLSSTMIPTASNQQQENLSGSFSSLQERQDSEQRQEQEEEGSIRRTNRRNKKKKNRHQDPYSGDYQDEEEEEENDEEENDEQEDDDESNNSYRSSYSSEEEDEEDVDRSLLPKLSVLCQRGFRYVPKSLLHLEIELLTSCNSGQTCHRLETIDMRSIAMNDGERELVVYQTEACGVENLLADPPVAESMMSATPSGGGAGMGNMTPSNSAGAFPTIVIPSLKDKLSTPQNQRRSSMKETPRTQQQQMTTFASGTPRVTPTAAATGGGGTGGGSAGNSTRGSTASVSISNNNNNNNNAVENSEFENNNNTPSATRSSSSGNQQKEEVVQHEEEEVVEEKQPKKEEKKCAIQ